MQEDIRREQEKVKKEKEDKLAKEKAGEERVEHQRKALEEAQKLIEPKRQKNQAFKDDLFGGEETKTEEPTTGRSSRSRRTRVTEPTEPIVEEQNRPPSRPIGKAKTPRAATPPDEPSGESQPTGRSSRSRRARIIEPTDPVVEPEEEKKSSRSKHHDSPEEKQSSRSRKESPEEKKSSRKKSSRRNSSSDEESNKRSRRRRRRSDSSSSDSDDDRSRSKRRDEKRRRRKDDDPPRGKSRGSRVDEEETVDVLKDAVREVMAEAKNEFELMKQQILAVKQQNERKMNLSQGKINGTPRMDEIPQMPPKGIDSAEWQMMLKSLDSQSHFLYPKESVHMDRIPQTVQIIIKTEDKDQKLETPKMQKIETPKPEAQKIETPKPKTATPKTPVVEVSQPAEPVVEPEKKKKEDMEKPLGMLTEPVTVKTKKKKKTTTTHDVSPFIADEPVVKRKRKKRLPKEPEPEPEPETKVQEEPKPQVIATQTETTDAAVSTETPTETPTETADAGVSTNVPSPAVAVTQTITPPRTPELKKEKIEEENSDEDIETMLRQNRSKLQLLNQITESADLDDDARFGLLHEYLNKSHAELKPPSRPTTASSTVSDDDGAVDFDQPLPVRKRKPRRPSSAVVEQSLPNSSKFLQVAGSDEED
jgi:hypothetical protein